MGTAPYGGPRTSTPREPTAGSPGETSRRAGRQDTVPQGNAILQEDTVRQEGIADREDIGGAEVAAPRWWQTAWQRVLPPPEAVPDQHHQLNRQLAVLEGARDELESGWVQGRWWEVTAGGHPGHVDGACLVGALIRAGSGQNSENSKNSESGENSATGRAVDAVYDALWASRGQPAPTTHLIPSPQVRLARVRMLTQWNDSPERTKSEVMTVIDRAISATILALMATPRPAAPSR